MLTCEKKIVRARLAVFDRTPVAATTNPEEGFHAFQSFAAALAAGISSTASPTANAQIKWDMPTPYWATSLQTENITQFAAEVEKISGEGIAIPPNPFMGLAPDERDAQREICGVTLLAKGAGHSLRNASCSSSRKNRRRGPRDLIRGSLAKFSTGPAK